MVKFFEALTDELTVFVKQLAWLDTVPKLPSKSHDKAMQAVDQSDLTRREQMTLDGLEPMIPELSAGHHLISYLFEVGPAESGGMAPVPLSSKEIFAWCVGTGYVLSSWEFLTLRRLSAVYLAQKQKSESPDCPAPYTSESAQEHCQAVSDKLKDIFGSRIANQKRKTKPA